ncbi:ADP/ATP carrier receptor [Neolentinus lepideus HHB14362 ss-1]|uniref:ADP/ATP carrier receptor n=1 Tax=Neolentinus lepideus HHB14362 ss-1 TaxID=1314782 RepID=A0A165P8T2_9AGAM|nr:ADP/ATP carrier receptor [Neolentinus lepideus HHB14362 ss-1]
MSEGAASNSSLVDRVQAFVSENKRAVLIGTAAAVVAAAGVAYYASTSSRPPSAGDVEKGEKKKDKKKNKSSKKRKGMKDKDGPILEERKPKAGEVSSDEAAMSDDEKIKIAASLKAKGNGAYQSRKFSVAADFYTRAIAVSPKPEPVFYSNRAACYVNMSPPKYEQVVEDCDAALKLDSSYVKALNRRAMALEALDRLEDSLRDFTAATILDKFQNESSAQSVERVLKKLSTRKASEILANREKRLPSHTFVTAYFAAFRSRPLPVLPENPTQGDETLIKALEALEAADYPHAMTLTNEALDQGVSFDVGKAEGLNLRGTFKFLVGDIQGAKEDLLASVEIVPSFTQSWVKLASVYMEQGDPPKAFEAFEEAIKHNSKDPDIFYHRGQVLFIMNEFTRAADDYTKSTELDSNFVFSHIQLAVAQYKSGALSSSMATFRRTLKAFPQRSEPQNYYGELLLDQQRFQDAVEKFDRAIELERAKAPPMNVLPLVNKGLALYQWKQDIVSAEKCCDEALEIDAECEAAVATLAQLSLQQGKIDRAVQMFERQSELARSEPELANALTYQYASWAQLDFMKNYPQLAESLSQLALNMQ